MSNVARKYTGSTIFTVCIVYTKVCLRFSIVCWHLIRGVIMGFALNRTALYCVLYMLLGLFLIIFSNFGCVSYTRVRLTHECDLYTSATYTQAYTVIIIHAIWFLRVIYDIWSYSFLASWLLSLAFLCQCEQQFSF